MTNTRRFILDTGAILRHPEMLAHAGQRNLVIPEAVLRELSSRGRAESRAALMSLIHQAIQRSANIVISPEALKNDILASDPYAQRLSGADFDIARIAIEYAEKSSADSVVVVTLDHDLRQFVSLRGIKSVTPNQFLDDLLSSKPDIEIQNSVKMFIARQQIFLVISSLLSVVTALVGNLGFSKLSYLVSTVSVWGTVVMLPILGIVLYWYRQKFRLSYGIFEFFVGLLMTYHVFFPTFSYVMLTVVEGIQILGGLYVMVRGLDNISKGVEGTRAEATWKRIF